MRSVKTYILKLLRDSRSPMELHGIVTSVSSGAEYPFADGESLLELLRRSDAGHGQSPAGPERSEENDS